MSANLSFVISIVKMGHIISNVLIVNQSVISANLYFVISIVKMGHIISNVLIVNQSVIVCIMIHYNYYHDV